MDKLFVGLAAFVGGLLLALLGWFDSKEPFSASKFGASVVRALFAGIVFGVGYEVIGKTAGVADLLVAAAAGGGIDAGLKRAGIIKTV